MTSLQFCNLCRYTLKPLKDVTIQITPGHITTNPAAAHIEPILLEGCNGWECCKCHAKYLVEGDKARYSAALQDMMGKVKEAVDQSTQLVW